jgi:hypothetical protein
MNAWSFGTMTSKEWFDTTCTCAEPSLMQVSGQLCDDCGYQLPQAKKVD